MTGIYLTVSEMRHSTACGRSEKLLPRFRLNYSAWLIQNSNGSTFDLTLWVLSYSYLGRSLNSPNGWDGICPDLSIHLRDL